MIIYESTIEQFKEDVIYNAIVEKLLNSFREKKITGGAEGEVLSWNNSLHFMKDVLDIPEISPACKVAIEYNIPQTAKRVDMMIMGSNNSDEDHIVVVELKQWRFVKKYTDSSRHTVSADLRCGNTTHPCYQAYSYKKLLQNHTEAASYPDDFINPCAYLHNLSEDYRSELEDNLYNDWISEAPAFLSKDVIKLRNFIKNYVTKPSSDGSLLYKIDYGKIRPSKSLQDSLDSMLCGNQEFYMIDEQAVAFDYIMKAISDAQNDNEKHMLIIRGGPGTGKSVLAINVLADCIRKLGLNASYITKNMAPRNCYTKLLSGGNAKKEIDLKLAIMSPHSLPLLPENAIDVGIFDEAHRIQKKPFMYKGEDMLADAIKASRVSVFFIDEDQRVTVKDMCTEDRIIEYGKSQNVIIDTLEPYELVSQFRCNGSNGYLAFLNYLLGYNDEKFYDLKDYDIRIFDNPSQMKDELIKVDNGKNKSRMVAGYCYDWNVKNGRGDYDIEIGDFKAKWNLEKDENYAVNPKSINEVGCIHTVQGMEFDYVGVIVGKDLKYVDGKIVTDKSAISKDDKSSGIRSCKDAKLSDTLIRNTYRVLLTRGQKGCFIYFEDEPLRDYFRSMIQADNNL